MSLRSSSARPLVHCSPVARSHSGLPAARWVSVKPASATIATAGCRAVAFRSPPMTRTERSSAAFWAKATRCWAWQAFRRSSDLHGGGQVTGSHGRSSLPLARWVVTRSTTPTAAATRTHSAVRTGPGRWVRRQPRTGRVVSTASRSRPGSPSHTSWYRPRQTVASSGRSRLTVRSFTSWRPTSSGQRAWSSCLVNRATRPGRSQRSEAASQSMPWSRFWLTTRTLGCADRADELDVAGPEQPAVNHTMTAATPAALARAVGPSRRRSRGPAGTGSGYGVGFVARGRRLGAGPGRSGPRWLAARQGGPEGPSRADPELGEHLAQVPFDRAGADVQLRTDLGVREAVASEPRHLLLL